jgi:hypothetical protein
MQKSKPQMHMELTHDHIIYLDGLQYLHPEQQVNRLECRFSISKKQARELVLKHFEMTMED